MKKLQKILLSKQSLAIIIILALLTLYFYHSFISKQWSEYQLNKEFVCPENQTSEESTAYLYRYIKFYMDNYPKMNLQEFLGKRMQLLVSNNCSKTLQNLANNNNGALPDQNTVNELMKAPKDLNSPTLESQMKNQ